MRLEMTKYKVIMHYPDGYTDEEDEVFDSYADASDYGCYLVSCCRDGAETLNMSNPFENPDSDGEADFEVIEVEE